MEPRALCVSGQHSATGQRCHGTPSYTNRHVISTCGPSLASCQWFTVQPDSSFELEEHEVWGMPGQHSPVPHVPAPESDRGRNLCESQASLVTEQVLSRQGYSKTLLQHHRS